MSNDRDLYALFNVDDPKRVAKCPPLPPIEILSPYSRAIDVKLRRLWRDCRISAKAGNAGAIWFMRDFGDRWLADLEARNVVREVLDRVMGRCRKG